MSRTTVAFILAVIVQLGILAAVPARHIHALMTGTPVVLKTAPVDPYSIMSGYYVTLSYDISIPPERHKWPDRTHTTIYATLVKGDGPAWKAVAFSTDWPTNVPADAVVLKGESDGWRICYGLEAYFLPETMRHEVANSLSQHRDSTLVDVMVDKQGHAALVRLRIGDKAYEY
ncbi:MAG: GDYXXLXY domain-containing protein [Phycisphaerae bacterium]|jgi:uncharacterized membrane-anchored protein